MRYQTVAPTLLPPFAGCPSPQLGSAVRGSLACVAAPEVSAVAVLPTVILAAFCQSSFAGGGTMIPIASAAGAAAAKAVRHVMSATARRGTNTFVTRMCWPRHPFEQQERIFRPEVNTGEARGRPQTTFPGPS